MDSRERQAFLASIEAEEDFLSGTPPVSGRRLSAAGNAQALKSRNLIPPLNPTSDRRISLPHASKLVSATSPASPTVVNMPPTQDPNSKDKALLGQIELMIKASSDRVRQDIADFETSSSKRLDELSGKLTARLSKAETDLSKLGTQIAAARGDVDILKQKLDQTENALPDMIEAAVARKMIDSGPTPSGRRPRPQAAPLALVDNSLPAINVKEARYWEARRSLRLSPVPGDDIALAVISFLTEKLRSPPGRLSARNFEASRVIGRPDSPAQDQVVVVFDTVRLRDEIKSLGRNLSGLGRSVGMQLEPPDFLRSSYQSFQKLAYQLKRKNPELRRNVKFCDASLSLTMDVLVRPGAEWKTVLCDDAKAILRKARNRVDSLSRDELEELVDDDQAGRKRRRTVDEDSSDMEDDDNDITIVEADNADNNSKTKAYPSLTFINANARSLKPKVESLADCFEEKQADVAIITETWFQNGSEVTDMSSALEGGHCLGLLTRNRTAAANNGRQYGGVALVFRQGKTALKPFPLVNPDDFELVAGVGKIRGVSGKFFCVGCYMPPNLSQVRARANIEYLSDVVAEAKRQYRDCSILIAGDFNQWPAEEILIEHPDLVEVRHGPTKGDREIDRAFVNFSRSIHESGTLEPLETEEGNPSDHRVAWAKAIFERQPEKLVTYSYMQYSERARPYFSTIWLDKTGLTSQGVQAQWWPLFSLFLMSSWPNTFAGRLRQDGLLTRLG